MELTVNTTTYSITQNRKGEIWTNLHPTKQWHMPETRNQNRIAGYLIHELRKSDRNKNLAYIERTAKDYLATFNLIMAETDDSGYCSQEETISALNSMINFFKDLDFSPSFRFVNTFGKKARQDAESAKTYVKNYFALAGNMNTDLALDKLESDEFNKIIDTISKSKHSNDVNKRLKIYEGQPGTGKTTKAVSESDFLTVCNASILPADLMEDFSFVEGKATFKPSTFQRAMTEDDGYTITLDEGNLLPFETLRFLQTVTDGKTSFEYKGKTIEIKPNFKVIITMNLIVNGATFALPEPLVDRAYDIQRFSITAENLINAL